MHPQQLHLLLSLSLFPLLACSHGHPAPLHKRQPHPPLAALDRRTRSPTAAVATVTATTVKTTTSTPVLLTAPGTAPTTTPTATATTKSKKGKSSQKVTEATAAVSAAIGSGTSSFATSSLSTTFAPGATPPVTGAPVLPNYLSINENDWPVMDKLPGNLTSPLVAQYVAEVDMSLIPNIAVTGANGCQNTTVNADAIANAGADGNCWWTCGHCVRDTDITFCPPKETWGLSFDDGPSFSTPKLLDFLNAQDLLATFFVVGSRALENPITLADMYMTGHQISVHTWAHPPLTTISNEGVIAELAWSKAIIKAITGVTPNTFRPPYGDIDDRVRNIALQMGLQPIIWTTHGALSYDTQDWEIPDGSVSSTTVMSNFQTIFNDSAALGTGFIVLEHDLWEETVDLAVEYVLPEALSYTPSLTLEPIITCLGQPLSQAYMETFVSSNSSSGAAALAQSGGVSTSTAKKGSATASGSSTSKTSGGVAVSNKGVVRIIGGAVIGVVVTLALA